MIKLTVIICTFNRLKFLKKTLPIYLKNKSKEINFLILNNKSSDNTHKYLKKKIKRNKRIKYIKSPERLMFKA